MSCSDIPEIPLFRILQWNRSFDDDDFPQDFIVDLLKWEV